MASLTEATGHAETIGHKALTLRVKLRAEQNFTGPLGFDFLVVVDEVTAAVDTDLGVLLTLAVHFLSERVPRLTATVLAHPADFGPELTWLVLITVMRDF